jgi:SMI1 / KNR4 family (SUKH-1)
MSDLVALARRRVLAAIAERTGFVADPAEPIDGAEMDKAESRFGFPLPPLLKRLYTDIGNGGFGPGYGLMGLINGFRDDIGDSALESYELRREADPAELGWHWPADLLPICTWGCAIYSCIDCSKPTKFPSLFSIPICQRRGTSACFLSVSRSAGGLPSGLAAAIFGSECTGRRGRSASRSKRETVQASQSPAKPSGGMESYCGGTRFSWEWCGCFSSCSRGQACDKRMAEMEMATTLAMVSIR